ncbi:hypothetical protein CEXT_812491 [Caerostris extrusa]|uniref:Uncharacterized protein n=1 Tax=Caerostris extrusa TaxID=172846 RepID=A0AAV4T531_CAEEX|nr:hypothetical protein CEXT_812491 [Caerostris extrusa]
MRAWKKGTANKGDLLEYDAPRRSDVAPRNGHPFFHDGLHVLKENERKIKKKKRKERIKEEEKKKKKKKEGDYPHLLIFPGPTHIPPPFLKDERRRNCRPQMLHRDKFVPIKNVSLKNTLLYHQLVKRRKGRENAFKSDREI